MCTMHLWIHERHSLLVNTLLLPVSVARVLPTVPGHDVSLRWIAVAPRILLRWREMHDRQLSERHHTKADEADEADEEQRQQKYLHRAPIKYSLLAICTRCTSPGGDGCSSIHGRSRSRSDHQSRNCSNIGNRSASCIWSCYSPAAASAFTAPCWASKLLASDSSNCGKSRRRHGRRGMTKQKRK